MWSPERLDATITRLADLLLAGLNWVMLGTSLALSVVLVAEIISGPFDVDLAVVAVLLRLALLLLLLAVARWHWRHPYGDARIRVREGSIDNPVR